MTYLAGGTVTVLVVALCLYGYRWLAGREERLLDQQVREAHRAGDFRRAGDIQASRNRFAEAARLYAQGKEWARQARALEKVGEREAAGEAYMRAGEYAPAAAIFEALGDSARAAVCLQQATSSPESQRMAAEHYARSGNHVEAAKLFQALGEFERAADGYAKVRDLDPPDLVATMLENAALQTADGDPKRKALLARVADVAYKLGQHERAARAYDGAGQLRHAAELYERALRRFDLAAALYVESGETALAARLVAQAGGEIAVLRARETRARERGDSELARTLRDEIRKKEPRHPSVPMAREDETPTVGAPRPRAQVPASKRSLAESGSRYELVSELGRGGMGVVHRARDLLLGRDVALKFMPAGETDGPLRELFRREARAAAALSHPGIVTIFDIGRQEGREFIAMELVDGTPLDRLLEQRGGKLSLLEGLEVAEAALAALEYAHDHRVIHRDLKPSNLMKLRNGGIKVMDFGLAKQMGTSGGQHHTFIAGTPAYMPPEQLLGATDARSDLFAIGATLYELFTGQLPGHEHEPASSARAYPTPRQREALIPERLSSLVMRCLAHEPGQRPASASEVLAEVRAIKQSILDAFRSLGDEPVREEPSARTNLAKVAPVRVEARSDPSGVLTVEPRRPGVKDAPRPQPKPAAAVVEEPRVGRAHDPRSADAPVPTAARAPRPEAPQPEPRPRGPGVHVQKIEEPQADVVLGGRRSKP
jgi:tetratricopeptide (TPR) repeat protein